MAAPNLSEIATTTIQNRSRVLADNVSENNALLLRMKEKGKVKPAGGGETLLQELEWAENATVKNYSGYETLDVSPSETLTSAEFQWKQKAVAVVISGREEMQNRSKERMIDLLEARISNAEKSMQNSVAADMYSDGSADGGKQIGGLQLLVADNPNIGIVGGINRANYAFWKNKVFTATTDGVATTNLTIQSNMNKLWVQLCRGREHPDLILMDNVYYQAYWNSLQPLQRFTNSKLADLGYETLKYSGADVVLDGGYGGACPASHMYFLNTEYIHFRPHRDRNFVPIGGERFATNQDAMVKLIGFMGNMTLSCAFLQGVYKET